MRSGPAVILGGAGFIGSNLANRLLAQGASVRIFDNLSRLGVHRNIEWLRNLHEGRFELQIGDVRNEGALRSALAGAAEVFHFAAQVSASAGISNPMLDFEVNARGTLNVLEALRDERDPPPLFFASTNEVYGALDDLKLIEKPKRYALADGQVSGRSGSPPADGTVAGGFSESLPLDFCSPHGCSKGAADQYVLDYARTFDLPAVVLRMSSVYGPRQFGDEDQGWVAHFMKRSVRGEPVTVRGDGKQVRDVLFVDDLLEALSLARARVPELCGLPFNVGGGAGNTLSPLELLDIVEELAGEKPALSFAEPRIGDQRYYVSDIRRFGSRTGWTPRVDVRQGLRELYLWLSLPYERRRSKSAQIETRA